MKIKLLVIRTSDIHKLAGFFILLGFQLNHHRHGNGPLHYSAVAGDAVPEIYPLAKSQTEPDRSLRLGFQIDDFATTIKLLQEKEYVFSMEPMQTEFGFMAVVEDPDGRKIELYK